MAVARDPSKSLDGLRQRRLCDHAVKAALSNAQPEHADEEVRVVEGGHDDIAHAERQVVDGAVRVDGAKPIFTIPAIAQVSQAQLPNTQRSPTLRFRYVVQSTTGTAAVRFLCMESVMNQA